MLQVSFSGPLRSKVDNNGADIMVELYETGIVTDCELGENKSRLLTNDYVVRCCEKLLTVKDVSAKKIISGSVHFSLWEGFNRSIHHLIVEWLNFVAYDAEDVELYMSSTLCACLLVVSVS